MLSTTTSDKPVVAYWLERRLVYQRPWSNQVITNQVLCKSHVTYISSHDISKWQRSYTPRNALPHYNILNCINMYEQILQY